MLLKAFLVKSRSFLNSGGIALFVEHSRKMDNTKERKVANRKEKAAQRGKHYYAGNHNFHRKNTACPAEFTDFIAVSIAAPPYLL